MGNKGFTIVEVMVVVVIIGILSAIVYPTYSRYKVQASRADAQAEMLFIAQRMQAYRGANGSYAGATISTVYGGSVIPKQGVALYSVDFSATPTATGWTLIAKPIDTSPQRNNGWICLNDLGQKVWAKEVNNCTALSGTSSWDEP